MRYLFFLLLIIVFFAGCKYENSSPEKAKLRLVSQKQILKRLKAGKFNYTYAKFMNPDGSPLSPEQRKLLNAGKLGKDYYENAKGAIREVRIRPITLEDKFIEIQHREFTTEPLKKVVIIDSVNCNKLDSLFTLIRKRDQGSRTGRFTEDADSINQQMVISVIQKCGWPEAHLETIWLVFQHAPLGIMAHFYPELKAFADNGKLEKAAIALTEDRLLMYHGYAQLYGSQINRGQLHELENPETVNERRAEMGLEPIETYLKRFDLDFKTELARMQSKEKENE